MILGIYTEKLMQPRGKLMQCVIIEQGELNWIAWRDQCDYTVRREVYEMQNYGVSLMKFEPDFYS